MASKWNKIMFSKEMFEKINLNSMFCRKNSRSLNKSILKIPCFALKFQEFEQINFKNSMFRLKIPGV